MTTKKFQPKYSPAEKQRIVQSIRAVCIAQAELWDVLREVENDHRCSIETDIYLIGELAGDCSHPPSFQDLPVDSVWESFKLHSSAER
jgi:hypothetical protein